MTSYRDSGVDVTGAVEHVARIAEDVTSTWSDKVVGTFGGFAAGIEIPGGYANPVLMMSTDGVGTKLELARRTDLWDGVGFDLVAMCVDDLATVGAAPLGFVDYMAVGALNPVRDTRIVRSVARACTVAGCALLGGETAEHPGVMAGDAVDLAGAVVGVVDKGSQLGPHQVTADDVIIGLRSPNLRSNGYSLARAVLGDDIDQHAAALLEPSVIYAPAVLGSIATGSVHAAAHVTGGGLAANLDRSLPDGLGATIDRSTWPIPQVFELISDRGVTAEDMYSTFNMGIGFCLVVDPAGAGEVMASVYQHGPALIGSVIEDDRVTIRGAAGPR